MDRLGMVGLEALFVTASVALIGCSSLSSSPPPICKAAGGGSLSGGDNVTAYFGCGCFWHVQHELVTCVEEGMLKRAGPELTSFSGYAGSAEVNKGGHVCYYNYGSLGDAEVVSLSMPRAVADPVFELFLGSICVGGVRVDTQDRGAEYRSLVGFPGGLESELGRRFATVAKKNGVTVKAGQGKDGDERGTVWVMDTTKFEYHQAEIWHQFHDDMIDRYGPEYHELRQNCVAHGTLKATGCPDDPEAGPFVQYH